jgi:hypothetical protein
MSNEKNNVALKTFMIVFLLFLFSGALIILFSTLSRPLWNNGLQKQVEKVIAKEYPDITVDTYVYINSSFALNAAAYTLKSAKGELLSSYAVISRVITLYGPTLCVFLCTEDAEADFLGFIAVPQSIQNEFNTNFLLSQINYWEKILPRVLKHEKRSKS